ncbi:MAG: SPOR domain-containing protein [Candidatus Neomarinimicrobiota bacterium]
MKEIVVRLRSIKIPTIIFVFMMSLPLISHSQEWEFDPDSLRDDGPNVPLIINPLIDGFVPENNYTDEINNVNSGKEYNGFQIQVLSTKNGEQAENLRMELIAQLNQNVFVIFEAPNYKVRMGAFTKRNEAERLQKQLYSLGHRRAWVVRARITL